MNISNWNFFNHDQLIAIKVSNMSRLSFQESQLTTTQHIWSKWIIFSYLLVAYLLKPMPHIVLSHMQCGQRGLSNDVNGIISYRDGCSIVLTTFTYFENIVNWILILVFALLEYSFVSTICFYLSNSTASLDTRYIMDFYDKIKNLNLLSCF